MTGIVKTDQIQGAQGSSVTVPTGHTFTVTSNATVGGTLGVTGNTTAGGTLGVTGNTTVGGTLGVTGTTTLSGAANITGLLASTVGQNFAPEFIGNLYLAGNTTDACELTGCFTNTHQIYRLVGEVGASFPGDGNTRLTFLSGTDTELTSGYYGAGRHLDDAQAQANFVEADGAGVTINYNQSSTGSSMVDFHFFRKQHAYQILGMGAYHDQSGDRGVQYFGYKNNSALELTGFRLENNQGNNMSMVNISVYGYRFRQNASGEMLGAYQ